MKMLHRNTMQRALMISLAMSLAPLAAAQAAGAIPVPAKSGTPEGTAALIKASPKLSAGPFTLGMPMDEAVAKLKANGKFTQRGGHLNPAIGLEFKQLPGHPLIGGAAGSGNDPSGTEGVQLQFTMYPNKPVVSGINRTLSFTSATKPNVSNTLAALRKKYGPESGMTGANGLYWLFDYQGHPLSKKQMAELYKGVHCRDRGVKNINVTDTNTLGVEISKGYAHGKGNRPVCFNIVRVDADIQISDPGNPLGPPIVMSNAADWAGAASDVVDQLIVMITNTPLDYSASTVSRNAVLNAVAAEQQKKRDAAKTNKAPSL